MQERKEAETKIINVTAMNHLIIGKGNMGIRHGDILKSLGDTITYYDEKPELSDLVSIKAVLDYKYDSVLICTPPETHLNWVEWSLLNLNVPIFCEKPIITHLDLKSDSRPILGPFTYALETLPSLVGCNWRFCDCLPEIKQIVCIYCRYKIKNMEFKYLDFIHFIDLFWNTFGKPKNIEFVSNSVTVYYSHNDIRFVIIDDSRGNSTIVNCNIIHNIVCDMFNKQMEYWRNVIMGKEKSINPIKTALERTEYLISSYNGVKL